jgi:hypothetical protein
MIRFQISINLILPFHATETASPPGPFQGSACHPLARPEISQAAHVLPVLLPYKFPLTSARMACSAALTEASSVMSSTFSWKALLRSRWCFRSSLYRSSASRLFLSRSDVQELGPISEGFSSKSKTHLQTRDDRASTRAFGDKALSLLRLPLWVHCCSHC